MLSGDVCVPLHVGVAKESVLFCNFFDISVGMFENDGQIVGDFAVGSETRSEERAWDMVGVEPIAGVHVVDGTTKNCDGA